MLIGALTVLSRRAHQSETQMFLAIEEPELFQHPTQARAFASVLRELSKTPVGGLQIAYATHSPYFVDPRYFDQIRRVTNTRWVDGSCPCSTLTTATIDAVETMLDGFIDSSAIRRRWDHVCLKYLPEALFAETVILVEGDEDAAILQGLSERPPRDLAAAGVCVAPVSGKGNMMIPFAVLKLLGIQALMVVDNDQDCRSRMAAKGRTEAQIAEAESKHRTDNRALCRLVTAMQQDYPQGQVSPELFFITDTLESALASDLPDWNRKRLELISSGRGVDGKNAGTYELAARECADEVGAGLADVLTFMSVAA
jgi:predicted ATP-dependent endonuclease of OLD family